MYARRRNRWPKGAWMRLISEDRLRRQMQLKGMSLGQLAEDVNVSKGFISHLTAGRKKTCTPRVAEAIARHLGVDLELLFVPSVSIDDGRIAQRKKVAA